MAHKTKSGRSSQAWKDFERSVAQTYRDAGFDKAERVSRGDDLGASDTDVKIPEVPHLQIDCKYSQAGFSVISLFDEAEKKYVKKGSKDFLILPIKAGKKPGSYSVVRTEVVAELVAHRYLGEKKTSGLACPRCTQSALDTQNLPLGLALCTCTNCGLGFQLAQSELPGKVVPFKAPKPQAVKGA